jgi:enamine deaminase RidA (YjgF/YER057c/UK114 family)
MTTKRQKVDSGVCWERDYGYSRAVRVGTRIHVSGTTATGPDGLVAPGDPAGQTRFILDKIEKAISELGGRLEDVVRTRIYVQRIEDWQAVALVHGERFGHIQPANTLVEARLVGEEYLVEIEAEAEVDSGEGGD